MPLVLPTISIFSVCLFFIPQDAAFRAAAKARWQALRAGPISDAWYDAQFQDMNSQLAQAAPRNYVRWQAALNSEAYGRYSVTNEEQFAAEVQALHDWLSRHLKWMDGAVSQLN